MEEYRLDRNYFQIQSFKKASNQRIYWLTKTPEERILAAWYLICSAYGLDIRSENRLDRSHFQMRKRL